MAGEHSRLTHLALGHSATNLHIKRNERRFGNSFSSSQRAGTAATSTASAENFTATAAAAHKHAHGASPHAWLGTSLSLWWARLSPISNTSLSFRQRWSQMSDLSPFEVGQITALHSEGYSLREIAERIRAPDGIAFSAVARCIKRRQKDPTWTGGRRAGSGRPRSTTPAQDKGMSSFVRRQRGKIKVTARTVKRRQKLRKTSVRLVQRRLREAGLQWLRRRRKTLVPTASVEPRLEWARWVQRQPGGVLRRFVYVDGVSFYVDKSEEDRQNSNRLALGGYVWRTTERREAFFSDCVGPSSYKKAQGELVRVWGMLKQGRLHIAVLPHKTTMNRWVYEKLIRTRFPTWLRGIRQPLVIQDHERCLRCAEPLAALRDIGAAVAKHFPKHSQDLNAVENVWAHLRARLNETKPTRRELRVAFIARLRRAVVWLNRTHRRALLALGSNQRKRAREVIENGGHRTSW